MPYELRHEIYFHVLSEGKDEIETTIRHLDFENILGLPSFRGLHLVNQQISLEVIQFYFQYCNFRFVHQDGTSFGDLIFMFRRCIKRKNFDMIRKVTLLTFSIEIFTNSDCSDYDEELEEVLHVGKLIRIFPALTQFRLGLDLVECLPPTHELLRLSHDLSKDTLMLWDWHDTPPCHPMRKSLEDFKHRRCLKNVKVGVYWTEVVTPTILPSYNRQLYECIKDQYRAQFLVILQDWLGTRSVRCLGSTASHRVCKEGCCVVLWDDVVGRWGDDWD